MTIYIRRKRCSKCGELKALGVFSRDANSPDGRHSWYKMCRHDYRVEHRDQILAYDREYDQEHSEEISARYYGLRDQVFDHYGRECACCETTENLSLDHINGDGAEHRLEMFGASHYCDGARWLLWLIDNDFPDDIQVLCRPCNASKGKGDHCRLGHIRGKAAHHIRASNMPVTIAPSAA